MMMGLPLRCRYWSVLQVVAIVVCFRGKVSSEMVEGCVGSQLSLSCQEMKVIQITAVVLGDSVGVGTYCYIRDKDCTHSANASHTVDVQHRCNGQSNCTVDVLQEKIPCGYLGISFNNDYERITYICTDGPRNDMMNSTDLRSTVDNRNPDSESAEKSHEESTKNQDYWTSTDGTLTKLYSNTEAGQATYALPVVMVIICLIILLAIVLVVVLYKRKKRAQMKLSDRVAMTEVDNPQNESDINANETQGTSLPENNDPLSLYTVIDEDDFPKTDGDPVVYSEVELKETDWKEGQSDKSKAATEAHIAGPDGVKGLVNNGDCFPDHSYSLMSHAMTDINVNEPLVESYTRLLVEAVSKTPSPEDDESLTVIENDLYSH